MVDRLGGVSLALAVIMGALVVVDPTIAEAFFDEAQIDQIVHQDFEGYYSEYFAPNFAAGCGPTTPGSPRSAWPRGCCCCR